MLVASASPVIVLFISISLHFHGILNARNFEDWTNKSIYLSFVPDSLSSASALNSLTFHRLWQEPRFSLNFCRVFWFLPDLESCCFSPLFPDSGNPELSILIQPSALCSDWLILWHYPPIMPMGQLWACKTKTDKPYNKQLINLKHLVFTWKSQVTLA